MGCGTDGPDVDSGRFSAQMTGSMTDRLRGDAVYRMEDGRLTGLELSVDSTTGLSVDVQPQSQPRGAYEVVEWDMLDVPRDGAPPGASVFLEVPDARFEAVAGTLTVSTAEADKVSGSFVFRMEGRYDGVARDAPFVSLTGSFRATRSE
jgi:hypothetical protein